MRHRHTIREARFELSNGHEDLPSWHVAMASEEHDHPLVVVLGPGKFTVSFEGEPGETFHHGAAP
jgi:hypothetical protein